MGERGEVMSEEEERGTVVGHVIDHARDEAELGLFLSQLGLS